MSSKINRSNAAFTIGGSISNAVSKFVGGAGNGISNTVSKIVGDLEQKCQQLMVERDAHITDADHAERVAGKVKALLD